MERYRFVPHRDGKPVDALANSFETVDDDSARGEGSERFMALAQEFESAILYNHQGDKIDTWGRARA